MLQHCIAAVRAASSQCEFPLSRSYHDPEQVLSRYAVAPNEGPEEQLLSGTHCVHVTRTSLRIVDCYPACPAIVHVMAAQPMFNSISHTSGECVKHSLYACSRIAVITAFCGHRPLGIVGNPSARKEEDYGKSTDQLRDRCPIFGGGDRADRSTIPAALRIPRAGLKDSW